MLAILLAALTPLAAAAVQPPRPQNLVIIAVDGLRADHLGLYGYARPTSPALDARAASAVVFERAIAQASWTLPSFTTLFSSRDPIDHGINTSLVSAESHGDLLAEVLRAAGFQTAGFVGGHFLDPIYGLARGFELYRGDGEAVFRFFPETATQGAEWIRSWGPGRHFLFVHGNDVHPPFDLARQPPVMRHVFDAGYRGPVDDTLVDYSFVEAFNGEPGQTPRPDPGYLRRVQEIKNNPRDLAHIVAHYDAQIRESDEAIKPVFEALAAGGHDKDTVVVLMADHGLEFGEKGKLATGYHLTQYQTVIRVPLIVWVPGLPPRRVPEPVELMDVAPTLLQLLGVPAPSSYQGRSLVPLLEGKREPGRLAFSSSSTLGDSRRDPRMFSVQDERFKLIYDADTRALTLYDLAQDPDETHDASRRRPQDLKRLLRALSDHLRRTLP